MQIADIIAKKEELSSEELAMLTSEVERHPYFHAASLALTSALYKTQSSEYGNTLRRTAISIPDRTALFALIEGADYQLGKPSKNNNNNNYQLSTVNSPLSTDTDRTTSLINHFLGTLSEEKPRRVTVADATTDYMSYLMQTEQAATGGSDNQPMRGQTLIDDFIGSNAEGERIVLSEHPVGDTTQDENERPDSSADTLANDTDETLSPEYFTETMARIYIKQGKFDKAIKIITRLNAKYPKKNRYFADQLRFLNKLRLNQSKEIKTL